MIFSWLWRTFASVQRQHLGDRFSGLKKGPSFRSRLVGQILGQELMSKFVRAVSPKIGEDLGASSVRPEDPGNVAE